MAWLGKRAATGRRLMEENMARRLVMTLAMSLDGYIADEDGGLRLDQRATGAARWTPLISGTTRPSSRGSDLVVMGREMLRSGHGRGDFPEKAVLVATHRPLPDAGNVRFIGGDVCAVLREELLKPGKDVFIFGGGEAGRQLHQGGHGGRVHPGHRPGDSGRRAQAVLRR